jgi:hypothetical protein
MGKWFPPCREGFLPLQPVNIESTPSSNQKKDRHGQCLKPAGSWNKTPDPMTAIKEARSYE